MKGVMHEGMCDGFLGWLKIWLSVGEIGFLGEEGIDHEIIDG